MLCLPRLETMISRYLVSELYRRLISSTRRKGSSLGVYGHSFPGCRRERPCTSTPTPWWMSNGLLPTYLTSLCCSSAVVPPPPPPPSIATSLLCLLTRLHPVKAALTLPSGSCCPLFASPAMILQLSTKALCAA